MSDPDDENHGARARPRILYCHCAYANVIAPQVKSEVLRRLCAADVAFDGVADLCEMSARKDPALARLSSRAGEIRIAACYPRAVRWLFSAAGAELPAERVEILNMRQSSAEEVAERLLATSGDVVRAAPASNASPKENPSA